MHYLLLKKPPPEERSHHERHSSQNARLYVGSLQFNVTEEEIKEAFAEYGDIEYVNLHMNNETGRSKGFAFVQYYRVEDAKRALRNAPNIEIAGRPAKVGLVNEAEKAGLIGDLDDDEGAGLALNAKSRVILMQRLQRNDASPDRKEISPCIMLTNMFDVESDEAKHSGFFRDIEDDVRNECGKFGTISHISADRHSSGVVFIKFEAPAGAQRAINALQGRYFGGKMISAEYIDPKEYKSKYPSSR